jgi:two-component system copper resistance phosphate regulon response regulator CusR
MRILVVEDEPDAAAMLAKGLREQRYAVDVAEDGERALEQAYVNEYDAFILDVLLPRKNGLEVCRELRESGVTAPILMLTARDSVPDRVSGLDAGADDYLPKPFHFDELLARVRALLRRRPVLGSTTITVGDLQIDTVAQRVSRAGRQVQLTAREYSLLEYFGRRADEVVTRAAIIEHVWDDNYDSVSNLVEVYVQRLRRKVDDDHELKLIRTRRGAGYTLSAQPDDV